MQYYAALGDGSDYPSNSPVLVPLPELAGNLPWRTVALGCTTFTAIDFTSRLWAWGENYWIQVGNGDKQPKNGERNWYLRPQQVDSINPAFPNSTKFLMAGPGCNHVCGVTTTNIGVCWGMAEHGESGNGKLAPGSYVRRPTMVANPTTGVVPKTEAEAAGTWNVLYAGIYVSCGLDVLNVAYCMGDNTQGGLGIGKVGGNYATPQPVIGNGTWVQLAMRTDSDGNPNLVGGTCGLRPDGAALCWGSRRKTNDN